MGLVGYKNCKYKMTKW